jgi:tRNA 2-thiouridine synthesizing protein B
MILHTLNAPPSSAAFKDCLKVLQATDAVVLMGDGVYAALDSTRACSDLHASGAQVLLLGTDARLAGVPVPKPPILCIDIAELVALTERFPRQLAWY